MNSDPLATYLHDHLAGASGAIDLIEDLRDDHEGEPLSYFATTLLSEIQEDRTTLEELAHRLGGDYNKSKQIVAWVGSKLARVKLGRSLAADLGPFLALETLGWESRARKRLGIVKRSWTSVKSMKSEVSGTAWPTTGRFKSVPAATATAS
jgi:hypothetical protein